MAKMKDLTGQRFNYLTVVGFDHKVTYKLPSGNWTGKYWWKCKCDCGKEMLARADELKDGSIKSCGCMTEYYNFIDLTGKRFGRLVVLERDKSKSGPDGGSVWKCKCDCGNIVTVPSRNLRLEDERHKSRSCGCYGQEKSLKNLQKYRKEHPEELKKKLGRVEHTTLSLLNNTVRKDNVSGRRGVSWSNSKRAWVAQIVVNKTHKYLGQSRILEEAIKMREDGEKKYWDPVKKRHNWEDKE